MSASLLFVYGSLKRGFRHHQVIAALEFVCEASTAPGYRLVRQGEYPALVCGGDGVVRGEIYRVPAQRWTELDRFEGCPELYQREPIITSDGTEVWAYVIPSERGLDAVEIGECWLE